MIGLLARPYDMTVIATSGAYILPAFPASNLTNNDYGRVMGATKPSAGSDGVAVVFDLGSSKPVDVLGILWHNMASPGPLRVRASENPDGSTSPVFDQGYPPTTGTTRRESLSLFKFLATLPSPITARYWRIDLPVDGSGKMNTYSRAFIGKGIQFAIGPQKATLGAKDMNANVTTEVGESRSQEDQNLIRPAVSLSFEYAKQSEMEQLLGQYTLALGVSKPMLVCTDLTTPYIQDNTAFGRPEKVVTLESSIYDVWSFEAVVTSLGI